jgi:thiol:disulfide interchange protein
VEGEPVDSWQWFPYESDFIYPKPAIEKREDGRLLVGLPFDLDASVPAGQTVAWGGVIELQTAEGARRVGIDVAVPTAAAAESVHPTQQEIFAALLGDQGEQASAVGLLDLPVPQTPASASRSLGYYLLLALVGGVILNIMPCVLPVLSLKILGFVQHAKQDRVVLLKLGLVFALGVLASFLALALVVVGLQAAGDQLGWGFQFQNPTFVVIMAAVVFAFGLSLFGVYEITLPVTFGGGSGGKYAESFFNGVLATALATPCTAPFLGTALGFAFTQPAPAVVAIFLTIGLGLSIPYVVLSVNPAWLRFVPHPGPWMERFKQLMGFLLMATLVWLLWVLGKQIGVDGVARAMAFLTVLGLALWLVGSFVDLSSSTARRTVVMGLALIMVAASSWYFLRGPLTPHPFAATDAGAHTVGGITWEPFSIPALEQNVRDGNTVFVDFSAAWCWTCKVNERTVLADEDVVGKLKEHHVVTLLGDWTNRDPVITQVLRRYGRSGVPFYAVYPGGRLDQAIVLPEVITESIVMEALDEAGPSRGGLTAASR